MFQNKINFSLHPTLITHPEAVLQAMLCRGDEQESQSSEAVRRIVNVRIEGDEETLLGDGGGGHQGHQPSIPVQISWRS